MTWRGAGLLLASIVVLACGAAASALYYAGVVLVFLSVAAIVVDSRRALGARALRVDRVCADLLSVGVANRVTLEVTVRTAGASAIVYERVPAALHASRVRWDVRLPASVDYTVTPVARGESSLGAVVVRVDGPWRLGWRQTTVGEPRAVRVDPNLAAIDVYEALARRGQLAEIGLRTMRTPHRGERVRACARGLSR